MRRDTKIGLVLVAIAIIVAGGALVTLRLLNPPLPLEGEVNILLINGSSEENVTLEQLVGMLPVAGYSAVQNRYGNWRDNGTYAGVPLANIVTAVGGIDVDDVVRVNATDGYSQSYAYYNIFPNATFSAIQGTLILAYSINGTTPPSWLDGPRVIFLPPDGGYSNDDANQTTNTNWFFGSAGARCPKNVSSIEILRDTYPPSARRAEFGYSLSSSSVGCNIRLDAQYELKAIKSRSESDA
jgi:hypothetical protein